MLVWIQITMIFKKEEHIGDTVKAKIVLVTPHGTICSINKQSLIENKHTKTEEVIGE